MKTIFKILSRSSVIVLFAILYSCESNQLPNQNAEVSFIIANYTTETSKKGTTVEGVNQEDYPKCTDDPIEYVEVKINGKIYKLFMTSLNGNQTEVIQLDSYKENILEHFVAYNSQGVEIYAMPKKGSAEDNGRLTVCPLKLNLNTFYKSKVKIDLICWMDYSYEDNYGANFQFTYNTN